MSSQSVFTTEDLALLFRTIEPDIPKTTINWRIYNLVQNSILERVGRGFFKFGETQTFYIETTPELKLLHRSLCKSFPFTRYCIWNTGILNEFSRHQSNQAFTLIEVEKESVQAVFYNIKETRKNVFLAPSNEVIENYLLSAKAPIIIKPLISEAPIQRVQDISVPVIEKILVDLYCEPDLFFAYQGKEMRTVFRDIFLKYTVNQSAMLRYSNRRGRKNAFTAYLNRIQIFGNK